VIAQGAPLRVLLVEDDDAYAALVGAELGAAGDVLLRRVSTLLAAEEALRLEAFDALLLDLSLPDSEGVETVERATAAADGVPIVVLTSRDDSAAALEAVHRGADDYLLKSQADAPLLLRSIRYARERAGLRRTLRASEEQLRQVHKMEAIGRLAGGVAHDFNNVLTAIFGYTDLLLEQFDQSDPRRHDLQEIRKSAERAAALTRQLLAFSRRQVRQPRVLDLNAAMSNIEGLLAPLVGADISITIRPAPDLWPVLADPGQIEQVLMNLAANARDAMIEGGELTLTTRNEVVDEPGLRFRPGLRPGEYVRLEVRDTGSGIPKEVRNHIFEPFFTTKEEGKGTGLGLATVYGIVKQTGGGIYVDSEKGEGTRFSIYLPRSLPER
jgi:two-component system, cell cycle sensor histidine kinase and response regulator CckA